MNILDKVALPANNILHSSGLLSVCIPFCSRKYMGCSRPAVFNYFMEGMFKGSHTSALFSSIAQHLQYLHSTAFNALFSPFANRMHNANCNCAPCPVKYPCLGIRPILCIKPYLHKHKPCQLTLLLVNIYETDRNIVCEIYLGCRQTQWGILTVCMSPFRGTHHPFPPIL